MANLNETTYRERLAAAWCQFNGQKGTAKQIARIRLSEEQLERMLAARGIVVVGL